MPIDFSILNQQGPQMGFLESLDKQYNSQADRNQRGEVAALQRQGVIEQNMINQQQTNQQHEYQKGLLEQSRQDLLERALNNKATRQDAASDRDLEYKKLDATKDFNDKSLGLRREEMLSGKEDNALDRDLRREALGYTKEDADRKFGLEKQRFNMDNSRNLFDQSIAMRDQLLKEKKSAQEDLNFEETQKYRKEISGAKSAQERQEIAQRYVQLNDAIVFGAEDKKQMDLAQQKGAEKLGVGLHGMLLTLSNVKDPKQANILIENYLRAAYKIADATGDQSAINVLDEVRKIKSPQDRIQMLTGYGSYLAKNAGLAMQNPSANPEAFDAAKAATSPSNPYMPNNIGYAGDAASVAKRALSPPALGGKAQEKNQELEVTRNNDALTRAQNRADTANEIAMAQRRMLALSKQADSNAGDGALGIPGAKPGPLFKSYEVGIGDWKVPIPKLGELQQDVAALRGKPENSAQTDEMKRLQEKIGILKAGKLDKDDPTTARILKQSIDTAAGPGDQTEDHEIYALQNDQAAADANAQVQALNAWVKSGRNPDSFDSEYWNDEQKRREEKNEKEQQALLDRQKERRKGLNPDPIVPAKAEEDKIDTPRGSYTQASSTLK